MQIQHSRIRTLLLVALIASAGCQALSGSSAPPSDERAVDAVTRAQEAVSNLTTYRFALDGEVQIRGDSRTEAVDLAGGGVVNVEERRANLTVGTQGDTGANRRATRTGYLDAYTLDIECSRMGWARYNLTESTRWLNYTALGEQLSLLDQTTVYWNGTEVVDGVETAVVTAQPTEQQLQASQNLPTGNVGTQGGATFENATLRVWIATETDRIRKVERKIHVSGGESTAVATVTFDFDDYDAPTSITRPSFEDSGFKWESRCPSP